MAAVHSGLASIHRRFEAQYRCYSVAMLPGAARENVDYGGKVILPPSALDRLTRLSVSYPMLFELTNDLHDPPRVSHAGVLEFIAEEGRVYLPLWMMNTLLLEQGDLLTVKSTDLPRASYVKIQPQSTDFLEISDPKAVLEFALRNFSTLTTQDIFQIYYNEHLYEIAVLEVKPQNAANAVSVVETDVSVDFAPPLGYTEPKPHTQKTAETIHGPGAMAAIINFPELESLSSNDGSFLGQGQKLNGKPALIPPSRKRGVDKPPTPLRLPTGMLFFGFQVVPVKIAGSDPEEASQFDGKANTLRAAKRAKGDATDVIEID
ncbi:Ubiquitin fusion degradation protein 1 [Neolecta irregularis DAH-3]|uniref:Ubiquitin fusion degradation protein 1 n=1 Tax=Neolecta irregularis (strain DAH-3) TaxID=1198029 RepID=A0A1U7LQA4_NEOID|nr:Ubiquitin fusion degradation protein 1 [Neolecta irregularis DAH-3]|eukprot:OLL24824.1 Ubiquitin fusion degradation protein 1 [Neolecta irregularis DAH-3]